MQLEGLKLDRYVHMPVFSRGNEFSMSAIVDFLGCYLSYHACPIAPYPLNPIDKYLASSYFRLARDWGMIIY